MKTTEKREKAKLLTKIVPFFCFFTCLPKGKRAKGQKSKSQKDKSQKGAFSLPFFSLTIQKPQLL
jgi:hypothetical protein